ncbi:hypothetical protein BaRGS_00013038 [Batillaria attramentaria]|uniref:Uncharacterized protein n=1 Tax=Batillaria attramentaria TaxID=370345 RepID=A0ABD0L8J6_9CAEN
MNEGAVQLLCSTQTSCSSGLKWTQHTEAPAFQMPGRTICTNPGTPSQSIYPTRTPEVPSISPPHLLHACEHTVKRLTTHAGNGRGRPGTGLRMREEIPDMRQPHSRGV